ncbi:cyclic peptide export ABC transporter [Pseudoalteromonas umbrosa]|uniref:cyclic peptide export ABC transporter n=1 Tax=Pseudoalteromonas umbrosa TaxID=3048489 RepID=UPI0024C2F700|nr:cyclic peptide export ABC transporter [Pseudoalteromonas sp. B95]MDK1288431.1 cyclic peptide export ABC transporter [Pseudoalteromonas sp. B95]
MIIKGLKRYWKLLPLFIIGSVTSAVCSLWLISAIQNEVKLAGEGADYLQRLSFYALGAIAVMVGGFIAQQSVTIFSTTTVRSLRKTLSSHLLAMQYSELEKLGPHKLQATLSTDVNRLSSAMLIFPALCFNSILVILCFGYLAYLSWQSFLILVSVIALGLIVTNLIMSRATAFFNQIRDQEDGLYRSYRGLTEGAKELNLNPSGKQYFLDNEINPTINDIRALEIKGQTLFNISNNWTNVIIFIALGAVVFSSAVFNKLPLDIMVAYVFVTIYLIGPLGMMISSVEECVRGAVAYKKILSLGIDLSSDNAPKLVSETCKETQQNWSKLAVKECAFHYETDKLDDSQFVVGPLNLSVERGKVLFVIGGNGSGKSTFAKLVTQLYQPQHGKLELITGNGSETAHQQLRIAAIFSDFFLFDWFVDQHGKPAEKDVVDNYLKRLSLDTKVTYKEGRISTTELSSGQRKRLALIQALILDPDIFLFDEWAADQDSYFREFFYRELLPELKQRGKTIIAISHDDLFFDAADRIIKFDQGHIQETLSNSPVTSQTIEPLNQREA